jgi:glutamate synthase domain-containing protein 2
MGLLSIGTPVPNWVLIILGFLMAVGFNDAFQKTQAVRRNFPIIGNFRYMLEAIRPEIQQYFVESNTDGRPIDRNQRSVVYQRAKKALQALPFGTQEDLYQQGREWICHSMFPVDVAEDFDRVTVGSEQCQRPYKASLFNISAMSYGSLSHRAVEALNKGAAKGGFYHNTGEGGIAPFHRKGGDLVWQIGTGYFGCRTPEGGFDADLFQQKSRWDEVKMIELKLSQGAKPGKGGMLPGAKVTAEIAEIRGVPIGKDVLSPSYHTEFSDSRGLLEFIQKLRELSGGKPVGFKLCVGNPQEAEEIFKQIEKTGILPDFITVDGAEGGTGAAPLEFSNAVGMPLKDGLSFIGNQVRQRGLSTNIKIIAAGKALTGFHLIRNFALGADIVNSARGMMLALGCIQALRCHSNHCPVGITTNNPGLIEGLDVELKAIRVANYHEETIKVVASLLSAMGRRSPREVLREDLYQRQSDGHYKTFAEIYSP